MKLCILSRAPKRFSPQRLKDAAIEKGHEATILHPLRCYLNITSHKPSIHFDGKALSPFDAVIPPVGISMSYYGTAVIRQFEMMGVYTLNSSLAIQRAQDKLRMIQLLSRKRIAMPRTGFASSVAHAKDMIHAVGGTPMVIKLLESTLKSNAVLAESVKAAEGVMAAFGGLNVPFLIQEYVAQESHGDTRVLVLDDTVLAAIKRESDRAEFPPQDEHMTLSVAKLSKAERSLVIATVKALGLRFATVDLVESDRGPLVMDVDPTPHLRDMAETTKANLAAPIIDFVAKHANTKEVAS